MDLDKFKGLNDLNRGLDHLKELREIIQKHLLLCKKETVLTTTKNPVTGVDEEIMGKKISYYSLRFYVSNGGKESSIYINDIEKYYSTRKIPGITDNYFISLEALFIRFLEDTIMNIDREIELLETKFKLS